MSKAPEWFNVKGRTAALLMFDLDKFKDINDSHGHEVGDAALKHFVGIIEAALPGSGTLFRLGGEEFAVVLLDASMDDAETEANRLRETLASSQFIAGGKRIAVTASVGVTHKSEESVLELDWVLKAADKCLYVAKESGRNRVVMAA